MPRLDRNTAVADDTFQFRTHDREFWAERQISVRSDSTVRVTVMALCKAKPADANELLLLPPAHAFTRFIAPIHDVNPPGERRRG